MRKTLLAAMLIIAACQKHETPQKTAANQPKPAVTSRSAPPPATPATDTDSAVGTSMPAYKAELLDGKSFDVVAERGNVVFLNLWATWCGPCQFEIPELQKLHTDNAAKGFKVVGVSLDDSGKENVQQFVTQHAITYPVALDPDGKLANIFQTTVIPTSVLIDRNGKIVWKKYGAITLDDELKHALDAALAQKRS